MWKYYALLSAFFAALTAIFAKIGVKDVNSYLATAIRTNMPAHAKCSLFGVSLTIPITNGRLNLGTWQGIYLCEYRDYGGERKIVATIYE